VMSWCHGTTGLGDAACPSAQPDPARELITYFTISGRRPLLPAHVVRRRRPEVAWGSRYVIGPGGSTVQESAIHTSPCAA